LGPVLKKSQASKKSAPKAAQPAAATLSEKVNESESEAVS